MIFSPRTALFAMVFGAVLFGGLSAAFAGYEFTCYPEEQHETGAEAPRIMFMLDRSGSMDFASTDPSLTRWDAATIAIDEVTQDMTTPGTCPMAGAPECDRAQFGIGFFSNSAAIDVEAAEDTPYVSTTIGDAMAARSPGGGTMVGDAAEQIRDSVSLTDATRPSIAILISDGGPSGTVCDDAQMPIDTTIKAVRMLCEAKSRMTSPVFTHSIGFGTLSSADTNSLLAAAGGTGSCCLTSDCENQPFDPCAATDMELENHLNPYLYPGYCQTVELKPTLSCVGSFEAESPSEFKVALQEVVSNATCTFPLDIPMDYPEPSAFDDPEGTRIRMEHTYGTLELPNVGDCDMPDSEMDQYLWSAWGVPRDEASYYDDEGWCFPDESRTSIRVTQKLCEDIKSNRVSWVGTELACVCPFEGESCIDTSGRMGFSNEQLYRMRCADGVYECIDSVDTCISSLDPLPETCNGVDDDCDGIVDNMDASKTEWEDWVSMNPGTNDPESKHCNFANTCVCPDGAFDDPAQTNDIQVHLDSWTGACTCGEGLGAPAEPSIATPALESEAACTVRRLARRGSTAALAALLALLALAFASRRRRCS